MMVARYLLGFMFGACLLSMIANEACAGWILGEGANLNGVPLDHVLVGVGDRTRWPFRAVDQPKDKPPTWISTYDIILGRVPRELAEAADPRDSSRFLGELTALHDAHGLGNARLVSHWVTPDWQVAWYPPREIQEGIDHGLTPVFLDWFFGDRLLGSDVRSFVNARLDAYTDHSRRLGRFLGQFDGDILVVMEPELNKPAIEHWPEFGDLIRRHGIAMIRAGAAETNTATGRKTNLFFGTSLADNGLRSPGQADTVYGTKARGDSYGWTLSRDLLERLRPDLDFIGFQEVLAQFQRDPTDPSKPLVRTAEQLGLPVIAERMVNYARYLREQLGIPIFLPYVGLATSRWDDRDRDARIEDAEVVKLGWEEEVGRAVEAIAAAYPELHAAGVFGISPMLLFDDPTHDLGGYQFLLGNEYALGLIATDAPDGIPGTPLGTRLHPKRFHGRTYLGLLFGGD